MNKMIFKSLLCFALCVLTLTAVSCGDDDDSKIPGGVIPVPQTASIVGNWVITNTGVEPHIIFFKADGTGGFMEYSTSSGTYHQDGEFRWVQNADGSYSFSGAGLHDGIQAMAITSLNGDNMSLWLQWPGEEKEYYTLKRTTINPFDVTVNIVGKWNIVKQDETSMSAPYDYLFFNADGTGGYMEYGSSGYHQDGEFRWVKNADGSYTFSGAGLPDGVYSMAIKNTDGNNKVEFEVYWSSTRRRYYYTERRIIE